ncbi:hypothetical protein RSOLAG22IIIB_02126 [Rhizoctonia solani]|uniref:Uncharacterized protein n=1 Tax=Rhizoctonia solani TaxID=456999 RepID=A0A0K6GE55_9AGAM|nr:hypothetical protein RSOLAG22IIIB_02126 [Rhizoctonia solani]
MKLLLLKTKLAAFQKVQIPNNPTSSSPPVSSAQPLPNISGISSSLGAKSPLIDWQSEGGKQVSAYLIKQRETLAAYQRECESLKSRVKELTAQLEAKNRPDTETITAIEKAELMEAELEGLHGRLAKCEDDLEKAQAELEEANSRNQQLTKETADLRKENAQQRGVLAKARFQVVSLQNRCDTAERDLASARESPRGRSIDITSPGRSTGERSVVYIPTATELERSAALLTSLQNDVSRLNREKSAIEQEITKLKESLMAKEEENQVIGGKLRQSAELAAELGKLHLAANSRAATAEEKLLDIQKEMQELKVLMELKARENKATQSTAQIASGLAKLAEQSRVTQLEAQLAEVTRVRDKAIVQSEIWQENRNSWKRWGELMALRAKQWEDEASKAKTPFPKDMFSIQPEEPPLISPELDSELGKSPKPQTDDSALISVDSVGEGTERKRARFAS